MVALGLAKENPPFFELFKDQGRIQNLSFHLFQRIALQLLKDLLFVVSYMMYCLRLLNLFLGICVTALKPS